MTTHLKFDNSKAGFKRVSEYLKSNKIKTTNSIIYMEATGHFHLNLFHYLYDKGFKVSVINPTLTTLFLMRLVREVKMTKLIV